MLYKTSLCYKKLTSSSRPISNPRATLLKCLLKRIKYLRLHSCGREGSCCWFSGCHCLRPLRNRLVLNLETCVRRAPIIPLPGTVSRRAVGPAGGLSWLQISTRWSEITVWWGGEGGVGWGVYVRASRVKKKTRGNAVTRAIPTLPKHRWTSPVTDTGLRVS